MTDVMNAKIHNTDQRRHSTCNTFQKLLHWVKVRLNEVELYHYFLWGVRNPTCQIKPLVCHRYIKHWSIFNPHIFAFMRALWYTNQADRGCAVDTMCWRCASDLVPEPQGQMEEDGDAEGHGADGYSWLAASRSTFVLLPGNPSVWIS